MNRLFLSFALVALIMAPSAAYAVDDQIHGEEVFNSSPVVCTGYTPTIVTISNPHPFSIRVLRVRSWVGLDYNRKADIGFSAQRKSDGNLFFRYLADRYSNPAIGPDQIQDLSPGIVLHPRDEIFIVHYCAKLNTKATVRGQFAFDWWYIHE